MRYYITETIDGTLSQVLHDYVSGEGDEAIVHPFKNLDLYTEEELNAIGIWIAYPEDPAEGFRVTASYFERVDGTIKNVIVTEPIPEEVPQEVTNAQAKIALVDAGVYEAVVGLIESHPDPRIKIWFNNALYWQRHNQYVVSLGSQLGLTTEQVDQLFTAASKID